MGGSVSTVGSLGAFPDVYHDTVVSFNTCELDSTTLDLTRWNECKIGKEDNRIDVRDLEHGDVFDCDCYLSSVFGGTVLNSRNKPNSDASTVKDGVKYVAVFSPKSKNNMHCKCGVVTSLVDPWKAHLVEKQSCKDEWVRTYRWSKHAIKKNRKKIYFHKVVGSTCKWKRLGQQRGYNTRCVGLCGEHCGLNDRGKEISSVNKRYKTLVIHDVCQAYIDSDASMSTKEGRKNNCGDEGMSGSGAARDATGGVGQLFVSWFNGGRCETRECKDVYNSGGNVCDFL